MLYVARIHTRNQGSFAYLFQENAPWADEAAQDLARDLAKRHEENEEEVEDIEVVYLDEFLGVLGGNVYELCTF